MLLFKTCLFITARKISRLVFKMKYEYKLKLQTPETIKLFGSKKKKKLDKTRNAENVRKWLK